MVAIRLCTSATRSRNAEGDELGSHLTSPFVALPGEEDLSGYTNGGIRSFAMISYPSRK